MTISIDFDGTLVTHEYPNIGKDIGAFNVLKKLQHKGIKLILLTMRDKEELDNAIEYITSNGIELYGINDNPSQHSWTNSRKIYADLYIDDQFLGVPLKYDKDLCSKPYVDWEKVEQYLIDNNIL